MQSYDKNTLIAARNGIVKCELNHLLYPPRPVDVQRSYLIGYRALSAYGCALLTLLHLLVAKKYTTFPHNACSLLTSPQQLVYNLTIL